MSKKSSNTARRVAISQTAQNVVMAMDSTACLSAEEVADLLFALDSHRRKVTASKKEALAFLKRIGMTGSKRENARG